MLKCKKKKNKHSCVVYVHLCIGIVCVCVCNIIFNVNNVWEISSDGSLVLWFRALTLVETSYMCCALHTVFFSLWLLYLNFHFSKHSHSIQHCIMLYGYTHTLTHVLTILRCVCRFYLHIDSQLRNIFKKNCDRGALRRPII